MGEQMGRRISTCPTHTVTRAWQVPLISVLQVLEHEDGGAGSTGISTSERPEPEACVVVQPASQCQLLLAVPAQLLGCHCQLVVCCWWHIDSLTMSVTQEKASKVSKKQGTLIVTGTNEAMQLELLPAQLLSPFFTV